MKNFHYHEPETVEQACALLAELGEKAKIIAGGTDLVVQMNRGRKTPEHVVSIMNIAELKTIVETEGGFRIGAGTPLTEVSDHPALQKTMPMLCSAVKSIGSAQVRNLATVGGNICNAAPSADIIPGLLVLDATITIASAGSSRTLALEDFFSGPGTVKLETGEMLTEIFVPTPACETRQVYLKHGPRKAMEIAVIGVAAALSFDRASGCCNKARLALGAVAPTPVRVPGAEDLVTGKTFDQFPLELIAETAADASAPITDVRSSAHYRREMVSTLTKRALIQLASNAQESIHA